MNLDQLNKNLTETLYKSFLFYIPQSLFEHDEKGLTLLLEHRIVDVLILVRENGEIKDIGNGICSLEILTKTKLLESNKFQLLEAKGNLEPFQFESVLESYLSLLMFYVSIAEWMYTHINEQQFLITKEQQTAFQLQSTLFKNHREEIYRYCTTNQNYDRLKKIFDTNAFRKEYSEVIGEIKSNFLKYKGVSEKDIELITPKVGKKRKRKRMVLTEQEAEDFLIKTVFSK